MIPEIKAKLLIDTGSTKSLLSEKIVRKYYERFIFNEEFQIKTAHMTSYHNQAVIIPIFNIFQITLQHKFYVFNFSNKYDGLIGIDLLTQLKAILNVEHKILETPFVKIPIIYNPEGEIHENYDKSSRTNYSLTISGRTNQIVKLPVQMTNGIALMKYTKLSDQITKPLKQLLM